MGKGFPVDALPEDVDTLFIMCTGSGISPVRALVESGALEKFSAVHLFHGVQDSAEGAYAAKHAEWEKAVPGLSVHQVYSKPAGMHTIGHQILWMSS